MSLVKTYFINASFFLTKTNGAVYVNPREDRVYTNIVLKKIGAVNPS